VETLQPIKDKENHSDDFKNIFSLNSVLSLGMGNYEKYTEFRERSTFFRGIMKTVKSRFRGIFSEQNFDGKQQGRGQKLP
jgi:hypothetical protein